MSMNDQNDLSKRLFKFSIRVIKFLRTLPKGAEYNVIQYQLVKCSTSVGANYEESQGAISRADFHNKVNISLKEMRESNYWLRILKEVMDVKAKNIIELNSLIKESTELKNILGTIVNKTKKT